MFTAGKKDFKEHWALNYSRYPASVEGMKWTELKTRVSGGSTKMEGGSLGTFCEYLNLGSVHTYFELMWKNKSNQLTALSPILHESCRQEACPWWRSLTNECPCLDGFRSGELSWHWWMLFTLHASIRASQSTTSLNQECILSREFLLRKTNE